MSRNVKKTVPMSLIPAVCGAVKALQSRNNVYEPEVHPRSMEDLNREGFELVKDAMQRALSKRVLEMTPAGDFRLKIITDKKKANELAQILLNDKEKINRRKAFNKSANRSVNRVRNKRSNVPNLRKTKLNKVKKLRNRPAPTVRVKRTNNNRSLVAPSKSHRNARRQGNRKGDRFVRDTHMLKSTPSFHEMISGSKMKMPPKEAQSDDLMSIPDHDKDGSTDSKIDAHIKIQRISVGKRSKPELNKQGGAQESHVHCEGNGKYQQYKSYSRKKSGSFKDKTENEIISYSHKKQVKAQEGCICGSSSKDNTVPLKSRLRKKSSGGDYRSKKSA